MNVSNKNYVSIGIVGLLAGLLSVSSCGVSDDGGAGDGLRIVDMDEAGGRLVLEYQQDGRRIQYDMRLGGALQAPPSAQDLAANPELPTHEVDLRVVDGGGQPFVVRMGRHDGDPDPLGAPSTGDRRDEVDHREDLALLARAVPELRALDLPPGLEQLRRAAIQAGMPPAGVAAAGSWSSFPSTCIQGWCVNHGNLVRLWQSILWADGLFTNLREIDGDFGPKTDNWTHQWQVTYVLNDDGKRIVGPITWGKAGSFIFFEDGGDFCQGGVYRFFYLGRDHNVRLTENCSTLAWRFQDPRTGAWTDTSFDY